MNKITLRTPDDAIGTVPYLLGFTPEYAVVLIGIKDGRVSCTMHAEAHKIGALDLTSMSPLAECSQMIGLAYAESFAVAETLAKRVPTIGLAPLTDFILVAGGRQRSFLCANEDCCPTEGTPIKAAKYQAEMVFAGVAPVERRADLYDELDAAPEGSIVPVLGDLLLDVESRDRYLAAACIDPEVTLARAAEVRQAIAATPADAEARPELLAVAATLAFLCGDGARANVALDVLNGEFGDVPNLARLIDLAMSNGMDPNGLRREFAELEV